MIGRTPEKIGRVVLAGGVALVAAFTLACGATYLEIPIETPIQPKLDVSAFQRVLVAGFVAGGSDDIRTAEDGWTVLTSDGSRAAHVEHTIAITEDGPRVLTLP